MEAALLHCPIRGGLRVQQRAQDALTFTEEKHRIDAIRYLLQRRYPRDNFGIETVLFRLGREGRNSFRTDFAVYDRPWSEVRNLPLETRMEHLRLLAEIKRDNDDASRAKATQVKAALQLVPSMTSLGVYWDNIEQRFLYRSFEQGRSQVLEAPISKIPDWGAAVESTLLTYKDLEPARDLVRVFDQIEQALHAYVVDKSDRYQIIQRLLLAKIHDENRNRIAKHPGPLDFQDFTSLAVSDEEVARRLNAALSKAANHYNNYLPTGRKISPSFSCDTEALRNISRILAPINILGSKSQVIQSFYMKFARELHKWDLAQYFTPHEVIDFIVDLANPQPGEHIYDPACGSADFLISAFRRVGPSTENCVWGADNSEQAVQISILNMVLNGDGKTQIKHQDSLKALSDESPSFEVVLCNPPFGTKILEKRFEVLRKFDMGHQWLPLSGGAERSDTVLTKQQTGILFAELCLRQAKPGGRVGLILPNGYLGNRSVEYLALREWMLRHARVVAVVAFPRFTFKKSGADVSASMVLLERRAKPLDRASDDKSYSTYFGNIESVGWRAGDKLAVPMYLRDPQTGEMVLDKNNDPVLDSDFEEIASDFLRSPAKDLFDWVQSDRAPVTGAQSEAVPVGDIIQSPNLILDPKRYSAKFRRLRSEIEAGPHFRLGEVADIIKEVRWKRDRSAIYKYVEIADIGIGEFGYEPMRGWELPQRARLLAQPGDIFLAHLWSSVEKWFIAAGDCDRLVVTNGCTRIRTRPSCEDFMVDLVVGFSSEAYRVQMRSLATGSDGLAEVSGDELLSIVLPRVVDPENRATVAARLALTMADSDRLSKVARRVWDGSGFPNPPPRKSHCSLV